MLAPAKRKGRPLSSNCEPERVTNPRDATSAGEIGKRACGPHALFNITRASTAIRPITTYSSGQVILLAFITRFLLVIMSVYWLVAHKSAIDPSLRFEIHHATSRLCLACG